MEKGSKKKPKGVPVILRRAKKGGEGHVDQKYYVRPPGAEDNFVDYMVSRGYDQVDADIYVEGEPSKPFKDFVYMKRPRAASSRKRRAEPAEPAEETHEAAPAVPVITAAPEKQLFLPAPGATAKMEKELFEQNPVSEPLTSPAPRPAVPDVLDRLDAVISALKQKQEHAPEVAYEILWPAQPLQPSRSGKCFIVNGMRFFTVGELESYIDGVGKDESTYELFEIELRLKSDEFRQWTYDLRGPKSISEIRSAGDYRKGFWGFVRKVSDSIMGYSRKSDEEIESKLAGKRYDVDANLKAGNDRIRVGDLWAGKKRELGIHAYGNEIEIVKSKVDDSKAGEQFLTYTKCVNEYNGKAYTDPVEAKPIYELFGTYNDAKRLMGRLGRRLFGLF